MTFRLATFNVENLMNRFDFSGFKNDIRQDRALALYDIKTEEQYRALESARMVAHTDDARQLTALAIAATRADIICLQEVDNLAALKAFEYGYLFKMIGEGYREKYCSQGNDGRGIDVAIMMRRETADGEPIEFVGMTSHAHLTFRDLDLHNAALAELNIEPDERIFRRDCLQVDLRIGDRDFSIFGAHFKAMSPPRNGMDGRTASMPVRIAEARAIRHIISKRYGAQNARDHDWVICGDLNDYRERVVISGDMFDGYSFEPVRESEPNSIDILTEDGFCVNVVERRPELDRWTLYHTRGPEERHLCQLDYMLLSPALAERSTGLPDIVRGGQPWRTPFPPGLEVERYPRTGWDRPKASDHCPVAMTLALPSD
ncbi:endonuclease/exonuclease/phosphatase family protein [Nitratireductor sp. CH_MIT9313-5]|uniref:endonuclease/exonuclease/phosphatase family protein n=1 Tax=Nitratireductor sp. CH_MIT9313-5 TaxID=3107764 RepID=UPI0030080949